MEKRLDKKASKAMWMCILFVVMASAPFAVRVVASGRTASDDDDWPKFGPWSAPVNLGPPVNTVVADYQPFIS